jgi:hypothetical protein
MDVEQFYDENPLRRSSEELQLGTEWHDKEGRRYELLYVISTQELYTMAAPSAPLLEDPFGDMVVDDAKEPMSDLAVEIIAVVPTVDDVHRLLTGWQHEMEQPSSLDWLRASVRDYAPS